MSRTRPFAHHARQAGWEGWEGWEAFSGKLPHARAYGTFWGNPPNYPNPPKAAEILAFLAEPERRSDNRYYTLVREKRGQSNFIESSRYAPRMME